MDRSDVIHHFHVNLFRVRPPCLRFLIVSRLFLDASLCIKYLVVNKPFTTPFFGWQLRSEGNRKSNLAQQLADLRLNTVMMDNNSTSNEARLDNGVPKFTLFPRLPIELREKIWEEACSEPRVIDLWALPVGQGIGNYHKLDRLFGETPFAYKTHQIDPAVLGACHQSKDVGHRHYEVSFGTMVEGYDDSFGQGPGAEIIIKTPALTFVNWKSDIICPFPTSSNSWGDFDPEDEEVMHNDLHTHHYRHKIHRIAAEIEHATWAIELMLKSHYLEEIILYIAPYRLTDLSYDDERPITIEFADLDVDMDTKLKEAGYGVDAKDRLQEAKLIVENFAEAIKKRRPEWKCPVINLMIMKTTGI
jgi:hypothetical protein